MPGGRLLAGLDMLMPAGRLGMLAGLDTLMPGGRFDIGLALKPGGKLDMLIPGGRVGDGPGLGLGSLSSREKDILLRPFGRFVGALGGG